MQKHSVIWQIWHAVLKKRHSSRFSKYVKILPGIYSHNNYCMVSTVWKLLDSEIEIKWELTENGRIGMYCSPWSAQQKLTQGSNGTEYDMWCIAETWANLSTRKQQGHWRVTRKVSHRISLLEYTVDTCGGEPRARQWTDRAQGTCGNMWQDQQFFRENPPFERLLIFWALSQNILHKLPITLKNILCDWLYYFHNFGKFKKKLIRSIIYQKWKAVGYSWDFNGL